MSTPTRLVLRSDVAGLGKRGDIVDVSPGHARNYLVPRGLAIPATPGVEAQAEAMRRRRTLKDAKDREAAQEIAKMLVPTTIRVVARAGEGGKLFGSVTNVDLVQAIAAQTKIELDRRAVHVDEHIKHTGTHQATVRLPGDVEFPVTIEVVAS